MIYSAFNARAGHCACPVLGCMTCQRKNIPHLYSHKPVDIYFQYTCMQSTYMCADSDACTVCNSDIHTHACVHIKSACTYSNTHNHTCTIYMLMHYSVLWLCGACTHFIIDCSACAGLHKQSSSQEIPRITPDTCVFSINCHSWHSTLSAHWAKFLHTHTQVSVQI